MSILAQRIFGVLVLVSAIVFAQDPIANDSIIQPQTGYNLGQLSMPNPISITSKYTYDPFTDRYIYTESIGDFNINYPVILTPKEYEKLVLQEYIKGYYKTKLDALEGKKEGAEEAQKNLLPEFYVNSSFFESIFGGNTIEVIPQGYVSMDIGFLYSKQDNPVLSPQNKSSFTFDFDQQISLSMLGKVGKRLQITANYDTESVFDFQNQIKLEYTPTEDDIIRKIEVGNVSLPLNSTLITGAQSLFGVKTELQFGKTTVTAIYSEQKSERKSVTAEGGGVLEEFELFALDYDESRHFFLSQYFRNKYNNALEEYPLIRSNVQITRLEVWVTNRNNTVNNVRNIVALQDLGEVTNLGESAVSITAGLNSYPDNSNNNLNPETIGSGSVLTTQIRDIATVQQGFGALSAIVSEGTDYSKLENARKLTENSEYNYNPQLGYLSLNQRLTNDEVLAVAYQFTVGGQVFQVGEFATDGVDATTTNTDTVTGDVLVTNQSLVLKMLKSNLTNVSEPVWDLMMKNVYALGAYQLSQESFKLDILYTDPSPVNFISEVPGTPLPSDVELTTLLQVFDLDKLNANNDPQQGGDGFFDFYPGITVNTNNGSVFFTKVEPFGEYLFEKLRIDGSEDYDDDMDLTETELLSYNPNQKKYVYKNLYASTKTVAAEEADKNKFQLKGRYKSSGGGGISIGAFNVPRGSVTVTAGGRQLVEGVDYTVDYQLGRVQILDEALKASGTPIDISVENNAVFGQQSKRFAGINVEHKFNDNFQIGGTFLNLKEKPLTQKANLGYEPINNTIVGFNGNYSTEVPFLTRLVNKLPNIDTDVPSNLSVRGEFAYLLPGSPKQTKQNGEATTYVDDFEAAQSAIDVKSPLSWKLASIPNGHAPLQTGVEPIPNNDLTAGFRRAKLAWYGIDPIFYSNQKPSGVSDDDISTLETRRVFITEVIDQDIATGQTTVLQTLDLAYYPNQRGPYNNYDPNNALDGLFETNPQDNWAGITRQLTTTDFEQSNVEFMEFWVQDPYYDNVELVSTGGKLTINLGSVSEDILRDGRKLYENGLPEDGSVLPTDVTSTPWGNVPTNQALIYAFDSEGAARTNQDVGLDGLIDSKEGAVYTVNASSDDPAGDNYVYYLNTPGTILERYYNYNGTEGNSPVSVSDTNRGSTTLPDVEDLNRDNTMNTIDSYYQYELDITPGMDLNSNFVRDIKTRNVSLPNGTTKGVRWIQFRVPLRGAHAQSVNGISDFRSIRFMRMFLSDFNEDVVLRFGTLELVRGDWRTYTQSLEGTDDPVDDPTSFEVGAVNTQENPSYVMPPGIELEEIFSNNSVLRQNEQSLSVRVNELEVKDSRAVYKNISIDMLQFKKMRMFIHAENFSDAEILGDRDLAAFIRMGGDLTNNYYQIEVPLRPSVASVSATEVWPVENEIDLQLDILKKIKAAGITTSGITAGIRYFDVSESGSFVEYLNLDSDGLPNTRIDDNTKYRIAIKGNPSLGSIRNLMLGVKNNSNTPVSGEVWFNELRLSDMDNKGGWAALLSADANIADFATVSASGKRSTIGFGSLEQGPNERSRDDVKQYDVVTNLNIGQLLPKKWGIKIPFNYGIGEEIITPKYDPLYQDLELQTIIDQDPDNEDFYKERAEDYTKRKSINFIGVRKERTGDAKPRVYDIENFTASYSYNQVNHRDYEVQNYLEQNVRTGLTYGFGFPEKSIEPLKKMKFTNRSKYYRILKDINFNLLPSNISFNSNFSRLYNKQRFRDVNDVEGIPLPDLYKRNYMFDWQYNIQHNLTKKLRFNFSATRNNIVKNYIDKSGFINQENKVWDGFFETGDPNLHSQQFQVNYELPLDKLPMLSFLKSAYSYTGDFQWQKGSDGLTAVQEQDEFGVATGNTFNLGNSVQNGQTHDLSSSLDMKKFYKYIGLEKKNFKKTYARALKPKKKRKTKKLERFKAKDSLSESKQLKVDKKIKTLTAQLGEIKAKARTKPKASFSNKLFNFGVGMVTSVKKIQVKYTENSGSYVPGYTNDVGFFGTLKPSLGYTFGTQSDNLRHEAAKKGWLTLYPDFNDQFTSSKNKQLSITANIEPIKKLKIDLNANRTYQHNYTENYIINGADINGLNGTYEALTPNTFGNFNISTILIKTAFTKSDETGSETFESFKSNRKEIAFRLARQAGIDVGNIANLDSEGYPIGYGKTSQQVLLPSFLAAYSGKDVSKEKTGIFRDVPLPNWSMKYTGLMEVKWFKSNFKRFSVAHGYKAGYTVNQFRTNLELQADPGNNIDQAGNIKSATILSNVNLTEQFSPLFKMDMEMKNSIKLSAEMKKDRALSLSLDNGLLTEIKGKEYVLGLGYRIKDLKFKTRLLGEKQTLSGDLNFKLDVSLRKNKTIVRYLDINNNQITAGQTLWSGTFKADYALSKNLTTLFYFDYTFSESEISTSFPQTTMRGGFTLRYNFGN
ncbi:MAG: cell surface protein SprA [Flavobacteriaceae bacterium]|nr:cell surface protein SprA [Flavobacteriaceae bacterium]